MAGQRWRLLLAYHTGRAGLPDVTARLLADHDGYHAIQTLAGIGPLLAIPGLLFDRTAQR